METGRSVILLNLESLYESLYDALNQVNYIFFKFFFYIRFHLFLSSLHTLVSLFAK